MPPLNLTAPPQNEPADQTWRQGHNEFPDPETQPRKRRRPAPLPDAEAAGPPTGSELRRAQPATWQLRLIKAAAEVIVSARRVLVRLSSAWPSLPIWRLVLQTVQRR